VELFVEFLGLVSKTLENWRINVCHAWLGHGTRPHRQHQRTPREKANVEAQPRVGVEAVHDQEPLLGVEECDVGAEHEGDAVLAVPLLGLNQRRGQVGVVTCDLHQCLGAEGKVGLTRDEGDRPALTLRSQRVLVGVWVTNRLIEGLFFGEAHALGKFRGGVVGGCAPAKNDQDIETLGCRQFQSRALSPRLSSPLCVPCASKKAQPC